MIHSEEPSGFETYKNYGPHERHEVVKIKRWVDGFMCDQCICHVYYPIDEKYSHRQRQVPQAERDPVQAVVDRQNQDRRNVVYESPCALGLHKRKEHSPEEQRDNDLKSQTYFVKEDAPLPYHPG